MAFLPILRLLLPEAMPIRNLMPAWLLRILSVGLPLIAHLPFYYMLHNQLATDGGCKLAVRNRVTFHMQQKQTYNWHIAAYHMTTPEVETALTMRLRNMSLFPMNLDILPIGNRMPSSQDEAVFNLRNSFNLFGHFFFWTGWLVIGRKRMKCHRDYMF